VARIDDYRESFRLAAQELVEGDLPRMAEMSGADMTILEDGACRLRVVFFGLPYLVRVREGVEVIREGWDAEVSLPEKILLCHYLLHAHDEPVRDQLITFRDIPDGHFYFEASSGALEIRSCRPLGGTQNCTEHVPVTWEGLPWRMGTWG